MNKSEAHIITGMSKDSTVSKFNPKFVYDAQNIRITARNGDNTLLSVTNERGPKEYTINKVNLDGKPASFNIDGTIIGCAVLNDYVIIFTTNKSTTVSTNKDSIYRFSNFTFDGSTNKGKCDCALLFNGNIGFSVKSPIETLPLYENDDIQKVYWVDGINQPRVINIKKSYSNNDSFNFNRTIKFNNNFKFSIEKHTVGGQFSVGTIQYAFSYFNKFEQETNLVDISPCYYISPKTIGLKAGSESNCSFTIKISGADNTFEYIRIYSVLRSSANATPICRIIGDYKIQQNNEITVVDNGIIGSLIDATSLFYIGGEDIVAGTIEQKDNTLFLGDIYLEQPNIGDIEINDIALRDYIKNHNVVENVKIDYNGTTDNTNVNNPSGSSFYDYNNNNNRSAYAVKRFIYGEGYRLGFAAQYKTGKWSEAIWIKDIDNTILPKLDYINSTSYYTGGFKLTLPKEITTALYTNGFIRVKPLVVLPYGPDRKVIAQGFLCPTVYNVSDRKSNAPFVQSSWFIRSIGSKYCGLGDSLPSNGLLEFKDKQPASTREAGCYDCEIQLMQDNLSGLLCARAGNKNDDLSTYKYLDNNTFVDYFGENYGVDSTILTFHSPEIECTDEYNQSDFEGVGVRVLGYSNNQSAFSNAFRAAWNIQEQSVGIDVNHSELINIITDSSDTYRRNALPLFSDGAVGDDNGTPTNVNANIIYGWIIYPWHRSGSLNNQGILSTKAASNGITSRTALLKYKRESNIWYYHTYYQPTSTGDTSLYNSHGYLHSGVPQLFNSDQVTALKIPSPKNSNLGTIIYYGNVDKVETPNMVDLSGKNFTAYDGISRTLTIAGKNKTNGYNILYGWIKYIGDNTTIQNSESSNYTASTAELARGNKSVVDCRTVQYNVDTNWWTPSKDPFYGKDPVSIKYKSTPHLVIALDYKSENEAYSIQSRLAANGSGTRSWDHSPFWKNNINSFSTITEDIGFVSGNGVLIADLYRKNIYGDSTNNKDYDQNAVDARFGGTSQEAISNNTWLTAGYAKTIEPGNTCTLLYTQGDGYLSRYDCLKTYPFTLEDTNSIVEILSTEVETRVNLDERYDRNRGLSDNTYITPSIFNLFNHEGYEQDDNFFHYQAIDYDRYKSLNYPNMVTWSLEKTLGEDIDNWTSIDLTSTQDLDGDKGRITALASFNNDLYCFQNRGLAQLLFNSRVQIATSDGEPIEISNGAKMQGKRYLSSTIGCTNKWSIQETQNGLYFIDDEIKSIFRFNGKLEELSTKLGMRSWLENNINGTVWNPDEYSNIKTFYDKNNGDVYFTTKDTSLCYSEIIDQFISFMSYEHLPSMFNVSNGFYCFDNSNTLYKMFAGDYNKFFGKYKPYSMTFVSNSDPTMDKVYNNIAWRATVFSDTGEFNPFNGGFDTLKVWNEYQDTGDVSLVQNKAAPSILKKKFNVWRVQIPRDRVGKYRDNKYLNRIRNPWIYFKLSRKGDNTNKMEFHDLNIDFFE